MKVLLLGKNGQLGWELHRTLQPLGEVIALDAPDIDFTDGKALREKVTTIRPQVIINAVAYTDVDRAERESDLVMKVNAEAPGVLASTASDLHALFIHYSTDFVFDGLKKTPYTETDIPNPLNVYAHGKFRGDQLVEEVGGAYLILRCSWIYSNRRVNFVKKVLEWAHCKTELRIVDDQVGSPTWARGIAEVTAQLIGQGKQDPWQWGKQYHGVYHLADAGCASRYEWAQEILNLDPNRDRQMVQSLLPALSSDFLTPAKRPLFTVLDSTLFSETFDLRLPHWLESLRFAMDHG